MKVALATCDKFPDGYADDGPLVAALGAAGVDAQWVTWGASVDADLVVLRSTWDYTDRRAEFLDWCAATPNLANDARTVAWNTDKRYLTELGVPTVATTVLEPGEPLPEPVPADFVLKPVVGAGSRGAARFSRADRVAAQEHLTWLHGRCAVLLQPYLAEIDSAGEFALVYLGGRYSHTFGKMAMLADSMPRGDAGLLFAAERLSVQRPPAAMRELGERVVDAAAARLSLSRNDFLYARVDMVPGADGAPVLLEFEVTEPGLGFAQGGRPAVDRFVAAVLERLGR